jgi:ATP-dependent exoDNAse (exonuclease V) beta subunit
LRAPGATVHTEVAVFAPVPSGCWIDGVLDLLVLPENEDSDLVVDWKTNRRRKGESDQALLDRLALVYRDQLVAYAQSIGAGLKRGLPRCYVYATAVGRAIEV